MSRAEVDVLVVGGGPAGMAAATVAAEDGASVLLVDENPSLGGQIWRRDVRRGHSREAERWLARLSRSNARVELGVTAADARQTHDGVEVLLVRPAAASNVRARVVVLCTGARERFLPFEGWTLPGVVGAGGAQALIKSGTDVRGRTVVVAGSGPLLLAAAAGIAEAGGQVLLVAEQASRGSVARYVAGMWRSPRLLGQAAALRRAMGRARYVMGSWVVRAEGRDRVERVTVTDGRVEHVLSCDLLCTGYGLVPETRLAGLLGCTADNGAVRVDAEMRTSVPSVLAAGEPTGIGGVSMAIAEGEVAGLSAAGRSREARERARSLGGLRDAADAMARAFGLRDALRSMAPPDAIVCRCEDVTLGDVDLAAGFRRARLERRVGMGACQGRICGDALAWLAGWPPEPVRPPVVPVPLWALAAERPAMSSPDDHTT